MKEQEPFVFGLKFGVNCNCTYVVCSRYDLIVDDLDAGKLLITVEILRPQVSALLLCEQLGTAVADFDATRS